MVGEAAIVLPSASLATHAAVCCCWVGTVRVGVDHVWHEWRRWMKVECQCTMVLEEYSGCGACGEVVDVWWSEKDF